MKKDYINEMSKFKKSILIVHVFVVLLSIFLTIVLMNFLNGDYTILLNNAISIAVGCFSTLLLEKVKNVQKEGKNILYRLDAENKNLNECICELDSLIDKMEFISNSQNSEFPIVDIYDQFHCIKVYLNSDVFDNVSIIGLNTVFDEIKSILLELKTKKDLIKSITKIQTLTERIKEIINEQIKDNNNSKEIFLKEEDRFYNLVGVKTKKKS